MSQSWRGEKTKKPWLPFLTISSQATSTPIGKEGEERGTESPKP